MLYMFFPKKSRITLAAGKAFILSGHEGEWLTGHWVNAVVGRQ